jgi:hypothetical protein
VNLLSISNLFFGLGSGIIFILNIAIFALCVWAIIDAAVHSKSVWEGAGQNKVLWITLLVVFTILFRFVGVILAIYYLAAVRPKLEGR